MRIAGATQYGQYSYLLAQCNLIVALGFGWLNQAQLRYYSKDSFHSHYKINQIKAILISVIFSLLILSILVFYQSLSMKIWIVSIMTISSMGCFNYLKTFYQAKFLPKKIIFLTGFQSLLGLLFALILMVLMGYNKISLLLGLAFSFIIIIIIMIISEIKNISFTNLYIKENKKNFSLIKKWFNYGSPLSLWFAAGLTLSYLDRFYINHHLPSAELGMYASIQELLNRSFSITLFPFTLALHPRIMNLWNKSKVNEVTQLILQSIFLMLSVGTIILFIVWQYNDLIFLVIQKIIPQLNIESKLLIVPLLCSGLLWQLSLLTHKMLELKEKTKFMIIAIIPSLIINIFGNSYFLPKLGVIATAYTAFFSALIYCMLTSIYSIYSINKLKAV